MDDLISRKAICDDIGKLIKEYRDECSEDRNDDLADAFIIVRRYVIKRAPAVDAAPVVHGRWIDENPDDFLDPRMRCSICTGVESPLIKWRYCPNCGAKMIGETDG